MKIEDRKIKLWEVGDYVRTPDGVGRVRSVDEDFLDGVFVEQQVVVQHKFNSSDNTSNNPIQMDSIDLCISTITKQEYDNEEE